MADTRYSGISFSVSQALANFLFLHDPAYLYRACAHFCALKARSAFSRFKNQLGLDFLRDHPARRREFRPGMRTVFIASFRDDQLKRTIQNLTLEFLDHN